MKKRLTESQFLKATKDLDVGIQTLEIARAVLVDGVPQAHFVKQLGVTKGAISQTVNRVWEAWANSPAEGFEKVTAILPKHRANQVREWEKEAKALLSRTNAAPPGTTEADK
ncbi:TrfB-related DNA-binding protein [Burkholderia aenigmatica]|uniref:TrfB-related DNA-binding protein n=1 Tax=Burkholderia aenigmatica TaxID=2015348 RepID=UPI00265206E9|nr:TrfB-related DNA-binding protein [Burkholderia aenigmatica]MDN7880078.1 TrfB-related DNA-binding protein [Burkholderia aenigmatica]